MSEFGTDEQRTAAGRTPPGADHAAPREAAPDTTTGGPSHGTPRHAHGAPPHGHAASPPGHAAPPPGAPPDLPFPVLRPVRTGNGFEEALEQILQVVRLGLVPAGERLPAERDLAGRLGVSRVTLREVLRVLHDEGVVESRRGRYGGTFVLARNHAPAEEEVRRRTGAVDVADVLRFREVLETGAAELCATHDLGEEGAGRLRTALAATRDAPLADYRRQDTLLHLTLAELSGSPTLSAQYAAVRAKLNDLLDCIPLLVRNLEHSQRQHTAVVDAVLAGDGEAARRLMREHCAGTAALLRGFLT